MGLVNTQFFVGTRCRLSRHRDARFVHGWVQFFRGESIVVTTDAHFASEPGDTFFIEAYGPKAKACMEAVLGLVEGAASAEDEVVGGAAPLYKLSLQLKGHLQVLDHHEAGRTMVSGVFAIVRAHGMELKAEVKDISTRGVGLLVDSPLGKGTEIELRIDSSLGPITTKGVVRHEREYRGKHKAGVELTGFSRLDLSRWKKLIGEAA